MKRVRVTPIAKIASRGKFKDWMSRRDNQSGMSAAGQVLLDGAQDDPYKALAQSVGAFFAGRNQDRRRIEEEGRQDELLSYERGRQSKEDARKEEDFELRKRAAEGALADEAERRALAEEERLRVREHFGTLPPDEQRFLAPFVGDTEKYFKFWGERQDDQQEEERFKTTFGEQQRHNKASEAATSRGYDLEAQRNQITREGQQMRGAKNKVVVSKGFVNVVSPDGEILSSTQLPADSAAAEREVARIMVGTGLSAEEAYAQTRKVKELVQAEKTNQAGEVSDDSTAKEIADLRAEGISDEDILAMATPAERERVRRLLGRVALPRR